MTTARSPTPTWRPPRGTGRRGPRRFEPSGPARSRRCPALRRSIPPSSAARSRPCARRTFNSPFPMGECVPSLTSTSSFTTLLPYTARPQITRGLTAPVAASSAARQNVSWPLRDSSTGYREVILVEDQRRRPPYEHARAQPSRWLPPSGLRRIRARLSNPRAGWRGSRRAPCRAAGGSVRLRPTLRQRQRRLASWSPRGRRPPQIRRAGSSRARAAGAPRASCRQEDLDRSADSPTHRGGCAAAARRYMARRRFG